MSELLSLFRVLNDFLDRKLNWNTVDALYTKELESQKEVNGSANPKVQRRTAHEESFFQLDILSRINDALPTLNDIACYLSNLRNESHGSCFNTFDCWDRVSEQVPVQAYLAFIYTAASLTQLNPKSSENAKLSLAAVNTYFLSLTIPGAKGFGAFDEAVIEHCIKVYGTLEHAHTHGSRTSNTWMSFLTLSDSLKLLFRLVHFKAHIELKNLILRRLTDILYMNNKHGYANSSAFYIQQNCFEIFEEALNPHNGEVEDTLTLLMNRTLTLHILTERPRGYSGTSNNNDCHHMSDWLIKIIPKYPDRISKVLKTYIEWILTNPPKSWKTEHINRALDFAAKYDAAIYSKCNQSCLNFFCDALTAEESTIRVRTIELIGRILLLESQVDWEIFRHEVSDIPREVYLVKKLIEHLKDVNNHVRLRAIQALQSGLTQGSTIARKILTESIKFAIFHDLNIVLPKEPKISKNELRFEKPNAIPANYTFNGHDIIKLHITKMPYYVYMFFFRGPVSNLRRAGILFIEQVIRVNPLVIYNTNFVNEMVALSMDSVAMVRKQAMTSVDALLSSYPNCYAIIYVWCRIWACLLSDNDIKNIELAMECFHHRVLRNIKGIEHSNKPEHYMPWAIIRELLKTQPRAYIQKCIQKGSIDRYVDQNILSMVESHLLASTSTEAWALLNFISGKIKSREPDALITHFTHQQKWDAEVNMIICLEVLINCLPHFSHAALNIAFKYVLKNIREGRVLLSLISKAMDFLVEINKQSWGKSKQNQQRQSEIDEDTWLIDLHNELVQSINTGISNFPENRYTFQGQLGAYSEVVNMLPLQVEPAIIKFVQEYMTACMKLSRNQYDTENERIFNWFIVISARLSLRENQHAYNTCRIYKNVLKNNDRPQIVNAILVSLSDLGKRHTRMVEDMFPYLLRKLSSQFSCNRLATFQLFEILVMSDQIKLRGSIMLALLVVIVDDTYEVAHKANTFFENYVKLKNPTLFHKCLAECPFILNEFKNFNRMDSFLSHAFSSPIKGENMRRKRRLLYNHFMATIDEVELVSHFEQLKLIADKAKEDKSLQSSEGLEVVHDVLFILRRICYLTKKQKSSVGGSDQPNRDPSVDLNESFNSFSTMEASTDGAVTPIGATPTLTGRGRGRKPQKLLMADALRIFERSLCYINTIHSSLFHVMNPALEKSFDKLCKALVKRFPSYIDYAQPSEFWNKYRKQKTATATQRNSKKKPNPTRRNKNQNNNDGDDEEQPDEDIDGDGDGESESDSDNELPLLMHKKNLQTSSKKSTQCDDLLTELVFNPLKS